MPESRKKILLVEDEPGIVNPLALELRQRGFEILIARNGEEGVRIAEAERPALIVLDIMLPDMNGITVAKRLAERMEAGGNRATPIMFLTSRDDAETISRALSGGEYDYLLKSEWKLDDLAEKIAAKANAADAEGAGAAR